MAYEDTYEPMRRLFRAYDVTSTKAARVLRCSRPTATARLKEPGKLTYSELRLLCMGCGVPADEMRNALRFGRGG